MSDFYSKENYKLMEKFPELAPEAYKAYQAFSQAVMSEGHLSKKEKEIIAVAVAHATECPYCIDSHTKSAKKAGATLEELFEGVMVTAALEAGGAFTHRLQMHNSYDGKKSETYYNKADLQDVFQKGDLLPEIQQSAKAFFGAATKSGSLSAKLKELIAVAIAHTTECPYCIDMHTQYAKKEGNSKEELAEAIMVASLLRSGGAVSHASNMMKAFQE
ncbi:carboxymuconolactone decarboxylase family protein [Metabacillus sp. RGM 3146]|uniref:carboxymuconolactone decarboxylase family protein n=1 Tax=Metabacillus sp. RGM 3146 TaxID=3401092 RepID=UPI003B9ACAFB